MGRTGGARLKVDFDEPDLNPWEAAERVAAERRREVGEAEQAEEVAGLSFREFGVERIPDPERGRIDLDRFAFQRERYDEQSVTERKSVDMKANQVGSSTRAVREGLYHADRGKIVIYAFPTSDQLGKFSRQRIAPAIRKSDYMRSRMSQGDVDRVDQKQIGFGWLYGYGTEKPIEVVNADVLIVDEYDFCDQGNLEASTRRVSGPFSSGILRYLSIPSYPGFGIAAEYEQSDQRAWTVKCGACNEWNPMRGFEAWQANVDVDRACLVCRRCRRELDVRVGEWVATFPDRDVRGYHTPKLIVPGLDLRPLIASSRKKQPLARQAFHNRDLGEPYSPAEGRLSREAVLANVRPDLRILESLTSTKVKTMAIDVGSAKPLTVTIRERLNDSETRLVYAVQVEDEPGGRSAMAQCEELMRLFGVNMAAVDNGPDGRWSTAFCRKFPGRAYRVAFFTPMGNRKTDVDPWNVNDTEQFCSVWRLRAIDATLAEFRMQHSLIPPVEQLPHDEHGDCEYVTHLTNAARRREDRPDGTPFVTYMKLGPDDFLFSEVYNLVAQELFDRALGMGIVKSSHPQALAERVDFKRAGLDDYESEPEYHAGPDDDFAMGDDFMPPELGGGFGLE
jgi:hypothetical protein